MKSCAFVGVGLHFALGAWLVAASVAACAGEGAPDSKTADTAVNAREDAAVGARAAAAEPARPPADPEPARDTPADTASKSDREPKPALPAQDSSSPRTVKYVLTREGLKIEVAGVRFLASAEAKQVARGWGVKVTVKAEATDGKEHVLLTPKNGPIAFAAAVFKKGLTEAERVPDSRDGEAETRLAGSPRTFSREFPNKGGRVLAVGETLDLEVALWGLGDAAEDRRPVKQFFHVKMTVDQGKPKAVVEPPASASGG